MKRLASNRTRQIPWADELIQQFAMEGRLRDSGTRLGRQTRGQQNEWKQHLSSTYHFQRSARTAIPSGIHEQ
jgi:hypothetical protein